MRWPWGRGEPKGLEEALNPVPAVEPAEPSYAELGNWEPAATAIGCGAALGAAELLGGVAVADFGWEALALAVVGVVGIAGAAYTRGRDHLYDRMRLAEPIPDDTEIEDDGSESWIGRAVVPLFLPGVVVLGGTEAAELLGGDSNHWFLLLAVVFVGDSVRDAAKAAAVRAEERERGVRFFRVVDREQYEEVKGELPAGDPGPMFTE